MSVRRFPKRRDEAIHEANLYGKNVEAAVFGDDGDCVEFSRVCVVMAFAEELASAGWRVKVSPFEDYPILHVRAKKHKGRLS